MEQVYVNAARLNVRAEPKSTSAPLSDRLWGDWLGVLDRQGEWLKVKAGLKTGWVREADTRPDRLLELYFIDVGQGDACLVQTPDDRRLLVDAGASDNAFRFIKWKYGGLKAPLAFDALVATHPDDDHFHGFAKIIDNPNIVGYTFYHNGIGRFAKAAGYNTPLGEVVGEPGSRALKTLCGSLDGAGGLSELCEAGKLTPQYAALVRSLQSATEAGRCGGVSRLGLSPQAKPKYLEGYRPTGTQRLGLHVLGPVLCGSGRLPWFDDSLGGGSKTRNGNSIICMLEYGNVRVLLAGDTNAASQAYLREAAGAEAFRADVLKCGHHGSADFDLAFIQAVRPAVSVISSGDNEQYSHPRADTIGALGKCGYGDRPLVFSTELARSYGQLDVAEATTGSLDKRIERLRVYGMIQLRTDGERVLMAQRMESPSRSGNSLKQWDVYELKRVGGGLKMAP
ncbi:MBL fold metallo-hydrolase [bacterium]|nr:MBL fold metallo-hydrolase [bacterium]